MDTLDTDNRRSVVTGAVIVAVLLVAVFWYIFTLRSSDTSSVSEVPTEETEFVPEIVVTPSEVENTPAEDTQPEPPAQVAATQETPQPEPVSTTSPTGPTEWGLGLALAALAFSSFQLRRIFQNAR